MIDFSYLERGWTALAKAHPAGGMAGHLGGGVLAGYFFGELNPELDPAIHGFVATDLDRIIGGEESIWFNQEKTGITITEMFSPTKKETEAVQVEQASLQIAEALGETMSDLRQSGHNVIFGSLALRTITDHPDLATAGSVDGIVKLMKLFRGNRPGRGYYGEEDGWKMGETVDISEVTIPGYDSLVEMAEVTIDELIATAALRTQGFGGLFHLIDHGAAIIELWDCGFKPLAVRGLQAHQQHLKYLRTLPDLEKELGALEKVAHFPTEPEYWARRNSVQWSANLTHRIKLLYGFTVLSRLVEDEAKLEEARDALKYLFA